MDIVLLYFDDCPSWRAALRNLRAARESVDVQAEVRLVRVESDDDARQRRFIGSPSIRVGDEDLFPTGHTDYGLGCRLYVTAEGMRGWPTVDMLREALPQRVAFGRDGLA